MVNIDSTTSTSGTFTSKAIVSTPKIHISQWFEMNPKTMLHLLESPPIAPPIPPIVATIASSPTRVARASKATNSISSRTSLCKEKR